MVERAKLDVTMATIAALAVPSQQPVSVDQKDLEKVLRGPLTIGQSAMGLIIGSQRDQVEVITGGNKINVRELTGRKEFSQSKIPTVLDYFVRLSASQLTSYGINFIVTVPCPQPQEWIRDNILASQISEKAGKPLIGGSATLKIASEHKTWTIKIEPGEDETINVDFNASEKDMQQLPEQTRLREEMEEQFNALLGFLTSLGL